MILHTIQGWVPATSLTSVSPADRSMVNEVMIGCTVLNMQWRSVRTVDAVMVNHSESSEARNMQVAWQKQ